MKIHKNLETAIRDFAPVVMILYYNINTQTTSQRLTHLGMFDSFVSSLVS